MARGVAKYLQDALRPVVKFPDQYIWDGLQCLWYYNPKTVECVGAVFASIALCSAPIVLDPIEFTVELGIKHRDMAGTLNGLFKAAFLGHKICLG
jgi:hypothetical protein